MTEDTKSHGGKPPFPTRDNPPTPGVDRKRAKPIREETLDEAIEESFPASDPISVDTRKPRDQS